MERGTGQLRTIFLVGLFYSIVSGNEMPRQTSGLKWISKEEAKNLPGGFWNKDLVRPGDNEFHRTFCRAEVEGCYYPGEAWFATGDNDSGYPSCRIISKTKVYPPRSDFQLLHNPEGAAQYTWLPWPEGTGNLNFPLGVVRSSNKQHCSDLKLARYHDHLENSLVDGNGYVYYQHGPGEGRYWDNNEYDLLVEKTVTKIELLELDYGDIIKREERRFAGEGDKSTSETVMTNSDSTETEITQTLSMKYTNKKSWSHSFEFSVGIGVKLEVSSPAKALTGGFSARFRFDTSFSQANGWAGGDEKTCTAELRVTKKVPAKTRIKVKMIMTQRIMDVPYTAKYRLTFQDGSVKTVHDKGVMKNAFYSNSQIVVEQSESQFTLRDQNFGQERLRSQKIVNQTRKYVRKGKAEKAETSCGGAGLSGSRGSLQLIFFVIMLLKIGGGLI